MKRSEINLAYRRASRCFRDHCWILPPNPHWDITDFGLGEFPRLGLTLVNLASEPEYCEKLMFAIGNQRTPCHSHKKKKEDIICRAGRLTLWIWPRQPESERATSNDMVPVAVNGVTVALEAGRPFSLEAGSRVTLIPGIWHAFAPESEQCIIGEVSTANDDINDNSFIDPRIGRFTSIEEDEPAEIRLVGE